MDGTVLSLIPSESIFCLVEKDGIDPFYVWLRDIQVGSCTRHMDPMCQPLSCFLPLLPLTHEAHFSDFFYFLSPLLVPFGRRHLRPPRPPARERTSPPKFAHPPAGERRRPPPRASSRTLLIQQPNDRGGVRARAGSSTPRSSRQRRPGSSTPGDDTPAPRSSCLRRPLVTHGPTCQGLDLAGTLPTRRRRQSSPMPSFPSPPRASSSPSHFT